MSLKCGNFELKTCAFMNLKQQKNLTRKPTINNCPNHRKSIRKNRGRVEHVLILERQQIAVPQENVYKP